MTECHVRLYLHKTFWWCGHEEDPGVAGSGESFARLSVVCCSVELRRKGGSFEIRMWEREDQAQRNAWRA